jgi:hypothetical protein
MNTFTFKQSGRPCPVCGTEKPELAFLMAVTGTEDGSYLKEYNYILGLMVEIYL